VSWKKLNLDSPLDAALAKIRPSVTDVGVFSLVVNLLMLTGSLYMLQVYDRVLASRSPYTLFYLTLVAAGALGVMALLDLVRSRVLVRVGATFDRELAPRVFSMIVQQGQSGQAFRDMHSLRTFLTGPSMLSFLDAPWAPIFLALVYVLHPALGHVSLAGVLLLLGAGILNDRLTRDPLQKASEASTASTQYAETSARNSEVVRAMGMLPGLMKVWRKQHDAGLGLQALASDRAALMASFAKFLRMFLQVAILCVGAYLVIDEQVTAGVMIASSIVMGRALAPVETAIGSWRGFVQAKSAYARLADAMRREPADAERMTLPVPKGQIVVDKLYASPPGAGKMVINGVSFQLEPGQCLGIAGPSAAGKSSLVRLLVGVWTPASGSVRLDGVMLSDWAREDVGPHIGYLPQEIELFPGTIADNIARFGKVDPKAVVEAAELAGVHQMILNLPKGYDNEVGVNGKGLSGGQRQRIGLARAFYRMPPLIVLDEPNSSLDAEGESAVRNAMEVLKKMGKTVIVIGHRPALLSGVDLVMVLQNGSVTSFGPASEVLPQITRKVLTRVDGSPAFSKEG
jgi:PrtD family type I secretion system ABC transporter